MTDRQLSNARKAQAEYLAYLRKWEAYTRSGEAFKPGGAGMEDAVTFYLGKFADTKNELYQLFRAHLSGRTEAERREFDERRGNVRAAFDALDGTNGLERLADALKTEAAAVESFDFCASSQEELVQAIAQAQSTLSEQLSKQGETIGEIESGQARLKGEVGKLRREIKDESTPGTSGGRPSCDHGDRQKLAVIKYAMSKRRDHASDYARHVFDSWKGAGGYGTADDLRKTTQRFLTNNGLPTLPTTETEHWDFVKAIENNAVITAKLEKLE